MRPVRYRESAQPPDLWRDVKQALALRKAIKCPTVALVSTPPRGRRERAPLLLCRQGGTLGDAASLARSVEAEVRSAVLGRRQGGRLDARAGARIDVPSFRALKCSREFGCGDSHRL